MHSWCTVEFHRVRLGAPCLIPKPDTRKGEALQVSVASGTGSPLDELLAAVDVVRCSGEGCVRHEVDGQGGDVGRADHAADRESRAELLATRIQLIAEERRRQRCVDKTGGDEIDANRRELECQVLVMAGIAAVRAEMRANPLRRAAAPVPPMKSRVPPGRTLFAS